ncbi:MAG: sugar porter family MFS transporter [Lewinellaceae bacterium]|nr:sugar porter family MFS transporter [Lewinellaceae bacterium]
MLSCFFKTSRLIFETNFRPTDWGQKIQIIRKTKNMNHRKIFYWSITVALAGFLFGFDTVVISGADQSLQDLWQNGELFHGFVVMASALWGTVLGAFFGGIPTDRLGRKKTLFWIGVFYFVSAVGSALAGTPWVFAFFRFLGGLGVGASTVAAPAYISEIAPANNRGKLVALYQFNIVFGILIAFLSNYLLSGIGENAWRWMIGVEGIPAFIYTLMVLTVPRSPRWLLVKKHDREAAAKTLRLIDPGMDVDAEMQRILADHAETDKSETIFSNRYRFPLVLAFLIAFFNQFSGINAFLYYAPRIFEIAGLEKSAALLSSVGIGLTNLVFTLIGLAMIDRFGRRQLMYIGSVGYIISLSLVAIAFAMGIKGMAVPIFLFLFIAAHAIGQGAVIWVFISEIFPTHLRAHGQAFGSSVHWVLAAAIPSLVPVLFSSIGAAPVFAFFAFMMLLQLLFVWRMMPETKGVSLEDLEKQLMMSNPANLDPPFLKK